MLVTASLDGTVKLWRVPPVSPHRDNVEVNVNRDAQGLFTLKVSAGPVWRVDFSPDGKRLATLSEERTVKLWDVDAQREIALPLKIDAEFVTSVAFSQDGKTLAVCDSDSKVKLWDIENVDAPQELSELKGIYAFARYEAARLSRGSGRRRESKFSGEVVRYNGPKEPAL
jgi:WD40 repeat protein